MFKKIPKNVFILGVVSLFNDIASEMIYPVVPIFLTTVLQAPVSIVGVIEGIAEGTASIMKFIFGYLSDRAQKRKIFVVVGYSMAALSKILIGLASSWVFVLFARFIDRTGKGLRTSARDSLLLQSANAGNKGFIFGFHRSLDSMGAVIGPIIALILLQIVHGDLRLVFLLAFIPALLSVILLVLAVSEKTKNPITKKALPFNFSLKNLNPNFTFFFIVSIIFALGNSSDAFLILRSQNLGLTTTLVVFAYVLYNISQTVFATPAGKIADKIGARTVFAAGLIIFSVVYFFFGIIKSPTLIWILFPIYGLYIAFTDGVSKAYIAEFIQKKESGSYFGLYQMGIALASVTASVIGGLLWTVISPSATFFFGSFMAGLAFIILIRGYIFRRHAF